MRGAAPAAQQTAALRPRPRPLLLSSSGSRAGQRTFATKPKRKPQEQPHQEKSSVSSSSAAAAAHKNLTAEELNGLSRAVPNALLKQQAASAGTSASTTTQRAAADSLAADSAAASESADAESSPGLAHPPGSLLSPGANGPSQFIHNNKQRASPAVAVGISGPGDTLAQWAIQALSAQYRRGVEDGRVTEEEAQEQLLEAVGAPYRRQTDYLLPVGREAVRHLLRREKERRLLEHSETSRAALERAKTPATGKGKTPSGGKRKRGRPSARDKQRAEAATAAPLVQAYAQGTVTVGPEEGDASTDAHHSGGHQQGALGMLGSQQRSGSLTHVGSRALSSVVSGRRNAGGIMSDPRVPPADWAVENRASTRARLAVVKGWRHHDAERDTLSQLPGAADHGAAESGTIDLEQLDKHQALSLVSGQLNSDDGSIELMLAPEGDSAPKRAGGNHIGPVTRVGGAVPGSSGAQHSSVTSGWEAVAPLVRSFVDFTRHGRDEAAGSPQARRRRDAFADVALATSTRFDPLLEPLRNWEPDDAMARQLGVQTFLRRSDLISGSACPAFTFATTDFTPHKLSERKQLQDLLGASRASARELASELLSTHAHRYAEEFFANVPSGEIGPAPLDEESLRLLGSSELILGVDAHVLIHGQESADLAQEAAEARLGIAPTPRGIHDVIHDAIRTAMSDRARQRNAARLASRMTAGPTRTGPTVDPIAELVLGLATEGGVWEVRVVSMLSAFENTETVGGTGLDLGRAVVRSLSVVPPAVRVSQVLRAKEQARLEQFDRTELKRGESWHLISEAWLSSWRHYIVYGGDPPGPIDNSSLLLAAEDGGDGVALDPTLRPSHDYRLLVPSAWRALWKRYSGGPVITQPAQDKEDLVMEDEHTDDAGAHHV